MKLVEQTHRTTQNAVVTVAEKLWDPLECATVGFGSKQLHCESSIFDVGRSSSKIALRSARLTSTFYGSG
jgi:hypothetical protein